MGEEAEQTETIHASSVAIAGIAVLLHGLSGAGKSDLALRLIDRGAALVSDDYTHLRRDGDRLLATPPATIAGKIEVRGLGVVEMPHLDEAPVGLLVILDEPAPRVPDEAPATRDLAGIAVPTLSLPALDASAPIKVELALRLFGLQSRPR